MLSLFSGIELKEVVGGKDKIDWGFIRKNVVEYDHPFKENHYLMISLWAMVIQVTVEVVNCPTK